MARLDPGGGTLPAPPRPVEKRAVLDDDFVLEGCERWEVVVVNGWWWLWVIVGMVVEGIELGGGSRRMLPAPPIPVWV